MSGLLDEMAEASWSRARDAKARLPLIDLQSRVAHRPAAPPLRTLERVVIAEIKFVAPSSGTLAEPPADREAAVAARAVTYARAGASAISVLTEPSRFGGHLDDLRVASAASTVPTMRKDFLVDPYQVWEARDAGAGGVLLIARMLSDAQLAELADAASEAGMFSLIEAFDAEELARSVEVARRAPPGAPRLVGVNTRDLKTLAVDANRLASLAGYLPADVSVIAESGMVTAGDVQAAIDLGYGGALVGSALMRADDPASLLARMVAACG